ncbi:DUF1990 family protein [Cellulomonas alba]|uniref:DUF1990 family protein n=1 Tax=Cellulomonas alba TaxID=3053467 RepID=A0ABT7SJG9_9CELL|nr:DUF1990 family protein [Cellulomonas alba]MDM7856330.1 DUF1990 family protein [Cellulomonas alba]
MTRTARTLTQQAVVGHGRDAFRSAVDGLMTWQMHRRAGVRTEPAGRTGAIGRAEPGLRVAVGIGPRRLALGGVCVVERVDSDGERVSLTYRTEAGHVEDGVQTFDVVLMPDGEVRGRITSTSTPAHRLLRALPGLGAAGQRVVARRYLRALRRLAAS